MLLIYLYRIALNSPGLRIIVFTYFGKMIYFEENLFNISESPAKTLSFEIIHFLAT